MGAVGHIELTDAKTGYASGCKLALCMKQLHLLVYRHPRQGILDTEFDWCIRILIDRHIGSTGWERGSLCLGHGAYSCQQHG